MWGWTAPAVHGCLKDAGKEALPLAVDTVAVLDPQRSVQFKLSMMLRVYLVWTQCDKARVMRASLLANN
jgi:hypothetical protein